MKKMAFVLFLINTFLLTGCSPQNRQTAEEESVTAENSSDSPSQIVNQQIPACDADETKSIVKDIVIKKYQMSVPYCSNLKIKASLPAINNSCEQLVPEIIYRYGTSYSKLEDWTYVDDFVTSFESYLVKSEIRAPDGNSSYCDLRVVASNTSAKTGIKIAGTININLTLYKKDQNNQRLYEYTVDVEGWKYY